jgi:hypothetical protein
MDNRLLARIAQRGGGKLLDLASARMLPLASQDPGAPKMKRSLTGALAGAAIVRIATRSVPGAIVVGGGLLAKALYDRRRARRDAANSIPEPDSDDLA